MSNQEPTPDRIHQLGFAFAQPLILEAAVELEVFDRLTGTARSLDDLVDQTGASQRGLRALLNALVGMEFLTKDGATYALTAESRRFLVSTEPEFQGGIFRHISRQLLPHWLHLAETVRSGEPSTPVNREDVGGEFFRAFVADLFPRGYPAAKKLADALGVAEAQAPVQVLDVAAGSGVWSIALAEKSPEVRVTVVDWPAVVPVAKRIASQRGLIDRYRFVPGDLLEVDFGTGYQIATLGQILHSEGPQRSRALLRKVLDALAPGGTIAIAEIIPNDERTGPAHALIFAVNMLVHTENGDTFSFAELSTWLTEAGFTNLRRLDVPGPSPLVLAEKP